MAGEAGISDMKSHADEKARASGRIAPRHEYIRNGGGASGAHSDIAHPEVAHAYWEAIIARA